MKKRSKYKNKETVPELEYERQQLGIVAVSDAIGNGAYVLEKDGVLIVLKRITVPDRHCPTFLYSVKQEPKPADVLSKIMVGRITKQRR